MILVAFYLLFTKKNHPMKKIILILVLALSVVLSANAQPHRRHRALPPRTYHVAPTPPDIFDNTGDIRLHVAGEIGFTDIGGLFMHQAPYHYSAGCMVEYQTSRCLSLGLGADFYGIRHINEKVFTSGNYLNCVPIYGNVRVNTTGFTKFFAELQLGYAIPTNQISLGQPEGTTIVQIPTQAKGFYSGAAVGISFYGNNVSVGFNSIDIINAETHQPLYHNGSNRKVMATDFYLRYSYAFPLN